MNLAQTSIARGDTLPQEGAIMSTENLVDTVGNRKTSIKKHLLTSTGRGRDVTRRCLMPPLTFEDFWFRASVRYRVLLMDWSLEDPQSTRSFEHNRERLSLMLTSLDGRIGQVLVQDIFHHFHARELFDIFTMDFAGCRPVKLEDTYEWTSLGDRDIAVYFNFFCRHDGRSGCARTNPTYRGRSNSYTGFKMELESMEQRKTAKLQDRKPRAQSQPKQADKKFASQSVSSHDAKASDGGLDRRTQRLPQELHDKIKETLFDVTIGPRQTSLETGKLYPNVLRAFNRKFYHQRKGTWLSSKLWTTFPHYPMRNPRDDCGRLTPISILSQLRTQVKQLSVTFDWSGLCQGCLAWLDDHYFKPESYPKHWLPHENKDGPFKNMFDIALDYLEDVKAANAEILEAWVHELSVIHDLALEDLVLDTRSAYNYSGEFIGLDVVKEVFNIYSHDIKTVVVKAPNNDLKEEILEIFEYNRSASMQ